ncbi:alpha-2 adrenergic receptor [Plakobranchus ocellatus]|uniref:Alpha-2 adrenergic receptor n=1 Tax=Plakobranchus ocellatus TaxID=259542 RepID=A0AAV4CS84_9GAST|nr:alpha-2 adrenergic receptor [Plakobranchus ocellatus]
MERAWSAQSKVSLTAAAVAVISCHGVLGYTTVATNNGTNTTSGQEDTESLGHRSLAEIVFWSILLSLILVTAVLGNLLVIACVRTTTRLREEKSNMFLVNLSITDVGSACVVMTSSLHALMLDKWHMGAVWCDLVCGANYAFIIVSMLTLCFISLDRYAAVVYALRYHSWVTRRRIRLLLAWAWFQGFCFGLAPVLADWVRYDYWEVVCAIVWHEDVSNTLAYVVVAFAVCFFLPGVILAVAYCKIIKVAKAQNNVYPHNTGTRPAVPRPDQPEVHTAAAWANSDRPTTCHAINGKSVSKGDQAMVSIAANKESVAEAAEPTNITSINTRNISLHRHESSPELRVPTVLHDHLLDGQNRPAKFSSKSNTSQVEETGLHISDSNLHRQVIQNGQTKHVNDCSCTVDCRAEKLRTGHLKADYPRKLNLWFSANGIDKFLKVTSFSAPVSPQCGEQNILKETDTGCQRELRKRFDFQISAVRCKENGSLLVRGCKPPQLNDSQCEESMNLDSATNKTLPPHTGTSRLSLNSISKVSKCGAWSEEHNEASAPSPLVLDATSTPVLTLNQLDSPTLSPSVHATGSHSCSQPNEPPIRPDSRSSCQFSEIPRSPEPEAVMDAAPHGRAQRPRANGDRRNYSASSKAVKSLLIVVLAFFICMTPFSITKLYKVIFPRPDSLPGYVNLVATIFQYCSSVINPLIYGIFRKDFQRAFLLIFKRTMVRLRLRDSIDHNMDTILGSL